LCSYDLIHKRSNSGSLFLVRQNDGKIIELSVHAVIDECFGKVASEGRSENAQQHPLIKHVTEYVWPAPGSEDTELGALMEPEVCHGEAEVHTRVQA
jgi:hypothetical protein